MSACGIEVEKCIEHGRYFHKLTSGNRKNLIEKKQDEKHCSNFKRARERVH